MYIMKSQELSIKLSAVFTIIKTLSRIYQILNNVQERQVAMDANYVTRLVLKLTLL